MKTYMIGCVKTVAVLNPSHTDLSGREWMKGRKEGEIGNSQLQWSMWIEEKRKKEEEGRKESWLSRAGRMVSSDGMCCGNEAIQSRKEGELRVC